MRKCPAVCLLGRDMDPGLRVDGGCAEPQGPELCYNFSLSQDRSQQPMRYILAGLCQVLRLGEGKWQCRRSQARNQNLSMLHLTRMASL